MTPAMQTCLRLLKGHGKLTAAELAPRWPGPIHSSTVQDALGTLWVNGYADRRKSGPNGAYCYQLSRKGGRYLDREGLSAIRHTPGASARTTKGE